MRNSVGVSVDVPVLFLATAITEMKMDELSVFSRYILSNFIMWGGKKREGKEK